MKNDTSPPPPRHELDHPIPTVIHQPEPEDPTLLKQWLDTALAKGPRFWLPAAALGVIALAVTLLVAGLSDGKAEVQEAWTQLAQAKTPAELETIARTYPATPASRWADYQAAVRYYFQGFNDLPANREAALPILKKALDKFRQVAEEAPKDEAVGRLAALGAARTMEARDQLTEAIAAYRKLAADAPKTAEGKAAARLAARLERPESAAFYKQLYAYARPSEATLPPLPGDGSSGLPPGHPDVNGPTIPASGMPKSSDLFKIPFGLPPAPASPDSAVPPPPVAPEMPADVFQPVSPAALGVTPDPTPAPATKPETTPTPALDPTPAPATPSAKPPMPELAPSPAPEPELPENLFKPGEPPKA